MMPKHRRAARPVLVTWAVGSLLLALLPPGVGGSGRALNAVLFMTMGPAFAVGTVLLDRVTTAVATVIALATSLTLLVLSSEGLLMLGLWSPWRVAALVALATVAPTVIPIRRGREVLTDVRRTP